MPTPEELAAQEAEAKAQEAEAQARAEAEAKAKAEEEAKAKAEAEAKEKELWKNGEQYDAQKAMELIEKLRAENAELKPQAKKAKELEAAEQKRKDAELSEVERLQKQLAEAQEKNKAAELRELRRKVGEENKLPAAIYELLPGETEEEMEAKAKELAKALPKPALSPNNPGGGKPATTEEQWRNFMNGGPLPR